MKERLDEERLLPLKSPGFVVPVETRSDSELGFSLWYRTDEEELPETENY